MVKGKNTTKSQLKQLHEALSDAEGILRDKSRGENVNPILVERLNMMVDGLKADWFTATSDYFTKE